MIELIKKNIVENIPEYNSLNSNDFSLLKYCTPASGVNPGGKVIFLVFKGNDERPCLCVKTVRKKDDNKVIIEAYNNLQKLYNFISGSEFEKMFPAPLFLSENDQGISFSVETTCVGRKPVIDDHKSIVDNYVKFQGYLSKKVENNSIDISDYFQELLSQLNLTEEDDKKVENYFKDKFNTDNKRLCVIPQHGDLTLDNILIDGSGIKIFDCERFGIVNIAGFDLFHFLQKRTIKNFIENNEKIFNNYFNVIGCDLRLDPCLVFLYYLNEIKIKSIPWAGKVDFNFIIINFEKFI